MPPASSSVTVHTIWATALAQRVRPRSPRNSLRSRSSTLVVARDGWRRAARCRPGSALVSPPAASRPRCGSRSAASMTLAGAARSASTSRSTVDRPTLGRAPSSAVDAGRRCTGVGAGGRRSSVVLGAAGSGRAGRAARPRAIGRGLAVARACRSAPRTTTHGDDERRATPRHGRHRDVGSTGGSRRWRPRRRAARRRSGRRAAPSRRSSTHTRPPWRRTCSATRARPRPTPSLLAARGRRPRCPGRSGRRSASRSSSGTPSPLVLDRDLHAVVDLVAATTLGRAAAVLRRRCRAGWRSPARCGACRPAPRRRPRSSSSSTGTPPPPSALTAWITISATCTSSRCELDGAGVEAGDLEQVLDELLEAVDVGRPSGRARPGPARAARRAGSRAPRPTRPASSAASAARGSRRTRTGRRARCGPARAWAMSLNERGERRRGRGRRRRSSRVSSRPPAMASAAVPTSSSGRSARRLAHQPEQAAGERGERPTAPSSDDGQALERALGLGQRDDLEVRGVGRRDRDADREVRARRRASKRIRAGVAGRDLVAQRLREGVLAELDRVLRASTGRWYWMHRLGALGRGQRADAGVSHVGRRARGRCCTMPALANARRHGGVLALAAAGSRG